MGFMRKEGGCSDPSPSGSRWAPPRGLAYRSAACHLAAGRGLVMLMDRATTVKQPGRCSHPRTGRAPGGTEGEFRGSFPNNGSHRTLMRRIVEVETVARRSTT